MNLDLLTIGNMFSQPAAPAGVRPEVPVKDSRFSPAVEHPQPPADAARPATPSQTPDKAAAEPVPEERKDFRDVIDEQTKPRNSKEARDRGEPSQQNAESKTSGQPDAMQTVLAQSPAVVEQNKEGAATTGEPKTPQQLLQLIDGTKTQNARPVIAAASTSPEIKPTGTAAKNQAGSEAVSPEALKNISAATTSNKQAESAGELPTSNSPAAGTKATPKVSEVQKLTPEASVDNSSKTANAGKEQTIAGDAMATMPGKTPGTSGSSSAHEVPGGSGVKTTAASEKTVATDAGKAQDPGKDTSTIAQPAQTEPSAPKSNKTVPSSDNRTDNPQEPLPTTDTEVGSAARQAPTRPAGFNSRNSANLNNNIDNPASVPAEAKTPAGQAESGNNQGSGDSLHQNTAQIFSQIAPQAPVAEQAPSFAVDTGLTAPSEQPRPAPADMPTDVSNQILESVRSSLSQQTGDKEITIQLNPPELGKVSVKFQQQGAEITGTLEVSKPQTRTEIEHALPEIIRSLADSGIAIRRLEVVLSQNEQSGNQASRDPLLQDGAFQQRDSAYPGQSGHEQQAPQTYYGPTARNRYQYQNPTETYEMLVTNTSINMLV